MVSKISKFYYNTFSKVVTYMKTMTCNQLAGACDMEFHAGTFDEMAQLSQKNGWMKNEKNFIHFK